MTSVSLASIIKLIRMGALIGIGSLTALGALINKNTFEGRCLFGRGRILEGRR